MHIVDWSSSYMSVDLIEASLRSFWRRCIHTASYAALSNAMYSASAVDNATHDCFFLLQLTTTPLNLNTLPEVDPRSSKSPAQSASEYPMKSVTFSLSYSKP